MKIFILFNFILLLSIETNKVFNYRLENTKSKCNLEKSLILGIKQCIPFKLKKQLKELSLLHLFTPSGLHLSSLLIFTFGNRYLKLFLVLLALFVSLSQPHLLALQRVSLFYLINLFIKNTKYSFALTFVCALIFGQYETSPMSYLFSFIFWYLIISHKKHRFQLVGTLFLIQMLISIILQQKFNLLAILINPLLTIFISTLFPLLLSFYSLDIFVHFRNNFYIILEKTIDTIYLQAFSILSTIGILILSYALFKFNKKLVFISLIFFQLNMRNDPLLYQEQKKIIYPIPAKKELNRVNNENFYFIDRKCKRRIGLFSCKLYPNYEIRVE